MNTFETVRKLCVLYNVGVFLTSRTTVSVSRRACAVCLCSLLILDTVTITTEEYIINQVTKFVTDKDVTGLSFLGVLLLMSNQFWGFCIMWEWTVLTFQNVKNTTRCQMVLKQQR